jgi:hypothetical protein
MIHLCVNNRRLSCKKLENRVTTAKSAVGAFVVVVVVLLVSPDCRGGAHRTWDMKRTAIFDKGASILYS